MKLERNSVVFIPCENCREQYGDISRRVLAILLNKVVLPEQGGA